MHKNFNMKHLKQNKDIQKKFDIYFEISLCSPCKRVEKNDNVANKCCDQVHKIVTFYDADTAMLCGCGALTAS